MNATINTFPPFQSMNSPRGWILAVIVLLHFGFFLALSSGMTFDIKTLLSHETVMVIPPTELEHEPPPPQPVMRDIVIDEVIFVPELPPMPEPLPNEEPRTAPRDSVSSIPPEVMPTDRSGSADPVIALPEIDPRIGLSEPPYPAPEIRAGHSGTVLLSVYVLANGRVGDVRLDQSSGYSRLDDSALREARRWRLKPGMRDGVPVAMWKQIPITFRLQGTESRRF